MYVVSLQGRSSISLHFLIVYPGIHYSQVVTAIVPSSSVLCPESLAVEPLWQPLPGFTQCQESDRPAHCFVTRGPSS